MLDKLVTIPVLLLLLGQLAGTALFEQLPHAPLEKTLKDVRMEVELGFDVQQAFLEAVQGWMRGARGLGPVLAAVGALVRDKRKAYAVQGE